jgi:integrase/recombinase XerD
MEKHEIIRQLFVRGFTRDRHFSAPLLSEREVYLAYLLHGGSSISHLRYTAQYFLNVIRLIGLTQARMVGLDEIENAGRRWYRDGPGHRNGRPASSRSIYHFELAAKQWFHFQGWLNEPLTFVPFNSHLADFIQHLRLERDLAIPTIRSYGDRVRLFLIWLGNRRDGFRDISLSDVDEFIDSRHKAEWKLRTIVSQCQALRTFFRYAESRGWCSWNFARGIRSPRVPKYDEAPKGPAWKDVRRLIHSASGQEPSELRSRAILLLFAIYGLRSSEVAQLRLDDLDWRNETLTVRRAKRGRLQRYPLQYEVGEAIVEYLKHSRPRCSCRNLFVTGQPPHRAIQSSVLWPVVSNRIRSLEIRSEHKGPHSLRHACATQLLKRGTPLKDIADFLGHSSLKCVSIYAKHDVRTLRKVSTFSLRGVQ